MEKNKVILITPDLYRGGIAKNCIEIASMIVDYSELRVVCIGGISTELEKQVVGDVSILNLELALGWHTGYKRILHRVLRPFKLVLSIIYLKVYLFFNAHCKVITLGHIPSIVFYLSRGSRRMKWIISDRTYLTKDLEHLKDSSKIKSLLLKAYRTCDIIHSQTNECASLYSQEYDLPSSKFCVIPNSIETIEAVEHRVRSKKIIWVGRLSRQKALLESLRLLDDNLTDYVEIDVYGNGEELSQLILESWEYISINFKGHIAKIPWRDYGYLLTTAKWEGMPNILLEALANGVYPFGFSCPCGFQDLLFDNGYPVSLFTDHSELDLLRIAKYASNPELIEHEIQHSQYSFAAGAYSRESVKEKWASLIYC